MFRFNKRNFPVLPPPLSLSLQMEDTLWSSLTDSYAKLPMALTAEKLGDKYGITREDCDKFALTSQQRWQEGVFMVL